MTQPAHNLLVIGDTWLAREFTKEDDRLLKAIAEADYWVVPEIEKMKEWQPFTQGWIKQEGPVGFFSPPVPVTYYRENMTLRDVLSVDEWDWNAVLDFSNPSVENLSWLVSMPELKQKLGAYMMIDPRLAYDVPDKIYNYEFFKGYFKHYSQAEYEAYLRELHENGFHREAFFISQGIVRLFTFYLGYLYGPRETSGQLYAWLWRFAKRDQILMPDILDLRFQWTYAPDFAEWLRLISQEGFGSGVRKVSTHVRPAVTHEPVRYGEWLELLAHISGRQPKIKSIAVDELAAVGFDWESDFPMTRPTERLFDYQVLIEEFRINRYGNRSASFEQSLRETWDYFERLGWPEPTVGLSLAREDELLGF